MRLSPFLYTNACSHAPQRCSLPRALALAQLHGATTPHDEREAA